MRATRATIDLVQLRGNIEAIQETVRRQKGVTKKNQAPRICLTIKSSAYGHGAIPVARAALQAGINQFGVATVAEGVELREAGVTAPILLLCPPVQEEASEIVRANLITFCGEPTVGQDLARAATAQRRVIDVHLEIDTGMGRNGCQPADAATLAMALRRHQSLHLTGVCTHFSLADDVDTTTTQEQLSIFNKAVAEIPNHNGLVRHAANSGAVATYPAAHLDLVRPGLIAYGYNPVKLRRSTISVKPIMRLSTRIVFLKKVPAGTSISYGRTFRTKRATFIATLPIGYGDGYQRTFSNRSQVLIRGRRYPVVGSICMDQCLVDLGPEHNVELYDEAVLFGPDTAGPDAAELATIAGTVTHEITSCIATRVPRIYRF